MIFVPTRHKSVTIFIKCFSCILLCFSFMPCLDISLKAFRIKPTVYKILMIDATTKEIVNFLFLQFLVVLRNQALRSNFDLRLSDVQL